MKKFVGIDISKETFDIYFEQEGKGCHVKLQQTEEDYKVLLRLISKDAICIMEATGNYHLKLAHYLHQAGIKVIAENPLKIKRFSQMSLQRTKTDKALMLSLFVSMDGLFYHRTNSIVGTRMKRK